MSAKNKQNSMWHKSKPRPVLWSSKIVKEEKATRRAENPAAKNAAYTKVYNLLVNKCSVGMTFDVKEVQAWFADCRSANKKVVHVPYVMPN